MWYIFKPHSEWFLSRLQNKCETGIIISGNGGSGSGVNILNAHAFMALSPKIYDQLSWNLIQMIQYSVFFHDSPHTLYFIGNCDFITF